MGGSSIPRADGRGHAEDLRLCKRFMIVYMPPKQQLCHEPLFLSRRSMDGAKLYKNVLPCLVGMMMAKEGIRVQNVEGFVHKMKIYRLLMFYRFQ